jgi:hypothetical protein
MANRLISNSAASCRFGTAPLQCKQSVWLIIHDPFIAYGRALQAEISRRGVPLNCAHFHCLFRVPSRALIGPLAP